MFHDHFTLLLLIHYFDLIKCMNLPHAVAEGRKIYRFRGSQSHKISLAVSYCSSAPGFLSGKKFGESNLM